MNITINKNGEFIDVDVKELDDNIPNCEEANTKDGLTSLAEGLSTANNMRDVQNAAKNILESEVR